MKESMNIFFVSQTFLMILRQHEANLLNLARLNHRKVPSVRPRFCAYRNASGERQRDGLRIKALVSSPQMMSMVMYSFTTRRSMRKGLARSKMARKSNLIWKRLKKEMSRPELNYSNHDLSLNALPISTSYEAESC